MQTIKHALYTSLILLQTFNLTLTQPLTKENLAKHNRISPRDKVVVLEKDCLDWLPDTEDSKQIRQDIINIQKSSYHAHFLMTAARAAKTMRKANEERLNDYLGNYPKNAEQIEESCLTMSETDLDDTFSDVESLNLSLISCVSNLTYESDLDKNPTNPGNPLSLSQQDQPATTKPKKIKSSWWSSCFTTDNLSE